MPDPITWYLQARTIDDDQSIMEAIDAKLLTHNQDPSAHGQTGESVYGHRGAPALDHPDGSIGFRKLSQDHVLINTIFESLDGWETIGFTRTSIINSYVATSGADNNIAQAYIESEEPSFSLDPTKNAFFQTTCMLSSAANQEIYIVCGGAPVDNKDDSYGFKILNGTLYAYWTKGGTEYTQAITTPTLTEYNVYRAKVISADEEIEFYVNGVVEYRATTNFPTDVNSRFFCYWVKATEGIVKRIFFQDLYLEIDR